MELRPSAQPDPSERFLRGRKKRGRAGSWLKKLLRMAFVVACGAAFAASAVWAVSAARRSPELSVHHVLVEGNVQLSDGEILEFLGLSRGSNILTLDLDEVRAKLLRSAWIQEVEVERVLPATLTLQIRERTPVAVAVLDELYLLAGDGTMLDQLSPRYDVGNLMLVTGLKDAANLVPRRLALAGSLAAALASDDRVETIVSEIDVSDGPSSIALHLRTHPVKLLVTRDTMLDRVREIAPLLTGLHDQVARLETVDLRFAGRIYLRRGDITEPLLNQDNTSLWLPTGGAPF